MKSQDTWRVKNEFALYMNNQGFHKSTKAPDGVSKCEIKYYRLSTVNWNTFNSNFHFIQTFFKIFATFQSFQC